MAKVCSICGTETEPYELCVDYGSRHYWCSACARRTWPLEKAKRDELRDRLDWGNWPLDLTDSELSAIETAVR